MAPRYHDYRLSGLLGMPTQRFPIRLGRPLPTAAPAVRGARAGGRLGRAPRRRPGGPIRAVARDRRPCANITGWRIEGPWRWITAIGVRRSVRHGDVTFGGSPHGGVRLDFRERVRVGPFGVPALYVTVDDLEGLRRPALRRARDPGVSTPGKSGYGPL